MRQIGSLLVRLNLETRHFHAEADRVWTDLVSSVPARHEYMQTLVRAYGFDSPLEAALRYTKNFDHLFDMTGRYRAGFIAQDLLSLGLGPAQVATIPQAMIAPFFTIADALGWLYVHERATLVHETVRHELCRKVPELEAACSYLSAYEGSVGAKLDDLGQQLEHLARSKVIADRVVLAAQEAFETCLRWVRAPEPHGIRVTN